MSDRRRKIKVAFNEFNLQNMQALDFFYADEVRFSDPLKKIDGLNKLKEYYQELYHNVESISFEFHNFIEEEHSVACEWTMTVQIKKLNSAWPYEVKGSSFFNFNHDDLVNYHRDFFDVGEMIYEKIPVFRNIIQLIKSRL